MTKKPKVQGPATEAPPEHPRSGGRWIRAADGSLTRETGDDEITAPDVPAASEETN